jgi:hypothetical protein
VQHPATFSAAHPANNLAVLAFSTLTGPVLLEHFIKTAISLVAIRPPRAFQANSNNDIYPRCRRVRPGRQRVHLAHRLVSHGFVQRISAAPGPIFRSISVPARLA